MKLSWQLQGVFVRWIAILLCALCVSASAKERVLVSFRDPAVGHSLLLEGAQIISLPSANRGVAIYEFFDSPDLQTLQNRVQYLRKHPDVLWVERDSSVAVPQSFLPNDSLLANQLAWIESLRLEEAWQLSGANCNGIVVALVDTGLDVAHPDISENVWRNTAETSGSTLDNDGNGYRGDYAGWNAIRDNGDVSDSSGHGTHVAGIIGAVGNNAVGVAGACWNVQLLPVKFLDSQSFGSVSDAVRAIYYVVDRREQFPQYQFIMNNSWVAPFSLSVNQALADATAMGILVVNAAGNNGRDLDIAPRYPAALAKEDYRIITVAASDDSLTPERLDFRSNWGVGSVTLAAPGVKIMSTAPRVGSDASQWYRLETGTSMATAAVSGVAALVWAANPTLESAQVRALAEAAARKLPDLRGKVKVAGTLDAAQMFALRNSYPPLFGNLLLSSQGYVVHGVNLDLQDRLLLNGRHLVYAAPLPTGHLHITNPDTLRSGYLSGMGNNQGSELYIEIFPGIPGDVRVLSQTGKRATVSWAAGWHTDEVVIEQAKPDGLYTEVARVRGGAQVVTLEDFAGSDRLRLQALSYGIAQDGSSGLIRGSAYSEAVSAAGVNFPVWNTLALLPARAGLQYRARLDGAGGSHFVIHPLQDRECFPAGLQLSGSGEIYGVPLMVESCRFRVILEDQSNGMRSIRSFHFDVVDVDADFPSVVVNETGDFPRFLLNMDDAFVGGTMQQVGHNAWEFRWFQNKDESLNGHLSVSGKMQSMLRAYFITEHGEIDAPIVQDKSSVWFVSQLGVHSSSEAGYYVMRIELDVPNFSSAGSFIPPVWQQDDIVGGSNGGGSSGCYIASEVYGDYRHERVQVLRGIRDTLLKQWPASEWFIRWYYEHSPSWVVWSRESVFGAPARALLRSALDGVVALARFGGLNNGGSDRDTTEENVW